MRAQGEAVMNKKGFTVQQLGFLAICVVLNLAGGMAATFLKLPVYLDAVGTIFSAVMLGPAAGMLTGILTGIVNAVTFDPISIYFIPTQLIVGFMTGWLIKYSWFKDKKWSLKKVWQLTWSVLLITAAGSCMSSIIVAFVFSGVTTSGSSLIVALLKTSGVELLRAVFSVQILTDLLDKALSFLFIAIVIRNLPASMVQKIRGVR